MLDEIVPLANGHQTRIIAPDDRNAFLLLFNDRIIASKYNVEDGRSYSCSLPDKTPLVVMRSANHFTVQLASSPTSQAQSNTQQPQAVFPAKHRSQKSPANHPAPSSHKTSTPREAPAVSAQRRNLLIICSFIMLLLTFTSMLWIGASAYLSNDSLGHFEIFRYITFIALIFLSCIAYGVGLFVLFFQKIIGFCICVMSLAVGLTTLYTFQVSEQIIIFIIIMEFVLFLILAAINGRGQ